MADCHREEDALKTSADKKGNMAWELLRRTPLKKIGKSNRRRQAPLPAEDIVSAEALGFNRGETGWYREPFVPIGAIFFVLFFKNFLLTFLSAGKMVYINISNLDT